MPIQFKKGKALDALSLTPLIDVVFLLLIFFLVATQFAQDDQQLPIKLPSATNAVPMTLEPDELVIAVGEDGTYAVRGQKLDLIGVERVVGQAVADNPVRQTVIIRGDRRVAFQSIVSLLDLMTRLKVPSYRITTEDPALSPGASGSAGSPRSERRNVTDG
jgi:biopolymer transport protein ExbD